MKRHQPYRYELDECDVMDCVRLAEYRTKRLEWLAMLDHDDEHSVTGQLSSLLWQDAVFHLFNEMRRGAPGGRSPTITSPVLAEALDNGYVTNMILGISRLVDGRNDVISLRRVFNDIRVHRILITREVYVCYDGLRYDVSKIPPPWERGVPPGQLVGIQLGGPLDASTPTRLHQMFDRLSNTDVSTRHRSNQISGTVFEEIDALLSDPLLKEFRERRNKFVAHAADPRSRANTSLSGYGITMADVEKSLRLLLRANHAIQSQLLWASGGGLMPTAQFNVLDGLQGSANEEQRAELGEVWSRLSEERNSWHEYPT
jgi:hypothetical protein